MTYIGWDNREYEDPELEAMKNKPLLDDHREYEDHKPLLDDNDPCCDHIHWGPIACAACVRENGPCNTAEKAWPFPDEPFTLHDMEKEYGIEYNG